MNKCKQSILVAAIVLFTASLGVSAAKMPKTLEIGAKAPNFNLPGVDGKKYKLALDGSGRTQRMTFFGDYPGYKASNPVVSDDGRYMAFQFAKRGDPAGVGRGILIFDLVKYEKLEKSRGK